MIFTLALALSLGTDIPSRTRIINTIGRFEMSDAGYACEWPGSALQFYGKGSKVSISLKASNNDDRWQVDIDGKPTGILKLNKDQFVYPIRLPDDKKHLITLVRRTECFTGKTVFTKLNNNNLEAPKEPSRKILIVGDSISAGYGVDGAKKEEHYSVETSDAYMTYGWVAARATHAEPTIVAWSGRKMSPDNTMPEIFDYILPNEKQGKATDDPNTQAVLINLGTNDFGRGIPNKAQWTGAYAAFAQKLRTRFPRAFIYLATGSMMSDNYPPNVKALTTLKDYLNFIQKITGDPELYRIDFAVQDERDGIGSDWHPNKITQTKMGMHFAEALHRDLGW
jgi:lysophospholipase L1-like esterase